VCWSVVGAEALGYVDALAVIGRKRKKGRGKKGEGEMGS
jgi:hypothetical protein